jgi:hypothetical protein
VGVHFAVGAGAAFTLLSLAQDSAYFGGPGAGISYFAPFRGTAIGELELAVVLSLVMAAMGLAASAAYARRLALCWLALAVTGFPCVNVLLVTLQSARLIAHWPAWTLAAVPPVVLASQIACERMFRQMDEDLLETYFRVREDVEKGAAAGAKGAKRGAGAGASAGAAGKKTA